jgi:hypothetical protein
MLSADYAHLLLFKEEQHSWERTDLHERAGLRMAAFRQGYEGAFVGFALELPGMAVPVVRHRRPKKRPKNRLARVQSSWPCSRRCDFSLLARYNRTDAL